MDDQPPQGPPPPYSAPPPQYSVPPPYPPPYGQPPMGYGAPMPGQQQQVPRCMRCGTVTWWKPAPLLRVMDFVIVAVLFLLFGVGLIYLIITLIMRSNPNNREKICPSCGADNQWTFIY